MINNVKENLTNEEPLGIGCAIIICYIASSLLCGVAYLIVKLVSGI